MSTLVFCSWVAGVVLAVTVRIVIRKEKPLLSPRRSSSRTPNPRPGWPETWGITFGLRCASAGDDVRFCMVLLLRSVSR